ncbi:MULTISPECIES: hypothetical protein [unclassified Streptomyces]|uniref:hypothetical protein n=1 Tax=unclassified Streptomyces TaxID=2593676 RepID=UPI002E0D251A|nr:MULTISPECIES: hypothetical protein [unclassified Streptomyces]WSR17832.1 hypothetical protein OG457_33920 [Streptomyces sp. NBC_01207]WTA21505.1 hypothetical protein OG365_27680 [Streptomyces sp. NBC_00853]
MLPSISLAQQIGLAVLLVAAIVWLTGLRHMREDSRFPHSGPAAEGLPMIPAQRGSAAHPMESVELTEAEKQAFAGLVRTISLT